MADETKSKLTYDASQAVKVLNSINAKLKTYNELIKDSVTSARKQNVASETSVKNFKDLNKSLGVSSRTIKSFTEHLKASRDQLKAQTKAGAGVTKTLDALKKEIQAVLNPLAKKTEELLKQTKAAKADAAATKTLSTALTTLGTDAVTVTEKINALTRAILAAHQAKIAFSGGAIGRPKFKRLGFDDAIDVEFSVAKQAQLASAQQLRLGVEARRGLAQGRSLGRTGPGTNIRAALLASADDKAAHSSEGQAVALNKSWRDLIDTSNLKNRSISTQSKRWKTDSDAMANARKHGIALTLSFENLFRIATSLAAYRGFFLLTQTMTDSVHEAKKLEEAIGEIQTISDRAEKTNESWRRSLLSLSSAYGIDVVESAEGAYQALSDQVVTAGTAIDFMASEARLAILTVSTLDEAVQSTGSVINAFGQSADDASRINAILFRTVDIGRVRLEEMAENLGRVSVLSDQVGISFTEQQAAITLLTRQGIKYDVAATGLRNVIAKLLKPTEAMSELLTSYGFTSGTAAIKTLGLAGTMSLLATEAKKGTDQASELAELFGDMRAINAAAALTQKSLNKEIEAFAGAPTDAYIQARERMKDLDVRANQQIQELKNSLLEAFGRPVLKLLVEFTERSGGASNVLFRLYEVGKLAIGMMIAYKAATIATSTATFTLSDRTRSAILQMIGLRRATAGVTASQAAMSLRMGMVGAVVAGVTLVIYKAVMAQKDFQDSIDAMRFQGEIDSLRAAEDAYSKLSVAIDESTIILEARSTAAVRTLRGLFVVIQQENNAMAAAFDDTFKKLHDSLKDNLEDPLTEFADGLKDTIKDLEDEIADFDKRTEDLKEAARDEEVRRELARIEALEDEKEATRSLYALKKDLEAKALEAAKTGNLDLFDEFKKRADDVSRELETKIKDIKKDSAPDKAEAKKIEELKKDPRKRIKELRREISRSSGDERKALIEEKDALIGELRNPKVAAVEEEITAEEKKAALFKEAKEAEIALEKEKKAIVDARIAAETAAIEVGKVRAAEELAKLKEREEAVKRFTAVLAEIDSFDKDAAKTPEGVDRFRELLETAGREASLAGFEPKEMLSFLRDANALQLEMQRNLIRVTSDEALKRAKENIDKIEDRLKKLVSDASEQQKSVVTAQTNTFIQELDKQLPAIRAFVGGRLADQNFSLNPVTNREAVRVNRQVREMRELLKTIDEQKAVLQKLEDPAARQTQAKAIQDNVNKLAEFLKLLNVTDIKLESTLFGGGPGKNAAGENLLEGESFASLATGLQALSGVITGTDAELAKTNKTIEQLRIELETVEGLVDELAPGWRTAADAAADSFDGTIDSTEELNTVLRETVELLKQVGALRDGAKPAPDETAFVISSDPIVGTRVPGTTLPPTNNGEDLFGFRKFNNDWRQRGQFTPGPTLPPGTEDWLQPVSTRSSPQQFSLNIPGMTRGPGNNWVPKPPERFGKPITRAGFGTAPVDESPKIERERLLKLWRQQEKEIADLRSKQATYIIQQKAEDADSLFGTFDESTDFVVQRYEKEIAEAQATLEKIKNNYKRLENKTDTSVFALGGTAHGTDRVHAVLTAGETVMNRHATRNFSPVLSMLNRLPTQSVQTSNQTLTFGDIRMPEGTSTKQVDAFVGEIKRRKRLGILNI